MNFWARIKQSGLDSRVAVLLVLTLILTMLHHTDHALRVDHSGWPFREAVTPFTYSLLVYPILLFALFGPRRLYWVRWVLLLGGSAFLIYAHTFVESPYAQYFMWANNESVHHDAEQVHNALNVEAPVLGVVATVISMALNIVAVVAMLAMLISGVRRARA